MVVAVVVAVVTLIGQFFDVRVTTATTTLAVRTLQTNVSKTRGIFQLSYIVDAATGALGFLVVIALAPLLGPLVIGPKGALLMTLFGLTLLASTVDDTSVTIMRVVDRFKLAGIERVPPLSRLESYSCSSHCCFRALSKPCFLPCSRILPFAD